MSCSKCRYEGYSCYPCDACKKLALTELYILTFDLGQNKSLSNRIIFVIDMFLLPIRMLLFGKAHILKQKVKKL